MSTIKPIYITAVVYAVASALALNLLQLPNPWPAAIALNVYGVVAWPGALQELPVTKEIWAGGWITATALLLLLEKIAPLVQ